MHPDVMQLALTCLSVLFGAGVSYGAIRQRLKSGDERMGKLEASVAKVQDDVSAIKESVMSQSNCYQCRTQCQASFSAQMTTVACSLDNFKESTSEHQLKMEHFLGRIEEHLEARRQKTI